MSERKQNLLEGQVIDAGDAAMLADQLDRLEKKIRDKKEELREIEQINLAASAKLRALTVALCAYFDDDSFSTNQAESVSTSNNSRWEQIKQRNPGRKSEVIDLLLIQRKMTISQIAASLRCAYTTAANLLMDMKKQGLLQNEGDGYAFKEI